ncbi:MAG: hypothetical protein IJH94_02900 [Clostridia bacterium]|nr:hypothetical protein [Clostridia bacterium]
MMKILNKSQLQLIAVIAMVIDHTAGFVTSPALYYSMRAIGRMTIVIMSYFVAEGFYKTRNVNRYIMRMAVFAAVSQVPFYLYEYVGNFPDDLFHVIVRMCTGLNVIFTLFVSLCLLAVIKSKLHIVIKIISFVVAWKLVSYGDWKYFCLLWVLAFGLFYGNERRQMKAAAAIVLLRVIVVGMPIIAQIISAAFPPSVGNAFSSFAGHINGAQPTVARLYFSFAQFGGLLAIPPLMMYNGEKGNAPRYGFYIFYPAHLVVLFFIKLFTH